MNWRSTKTCIYIKGFRCGVGKVELRRWDGTKKKLSVAIKDFGFLFLGATYIFDLEFAEQKLLITIPFRLGNRNRITNCLTRSLTL